MDRTTQLWVLSGLVERVRLYPEATLNELFEVLGAIERRNDLIPRLSESEEAEAARVEAVLERGQRVPELEPTGPVEEYLPEADSSILARLAALPERERDIIFGLIRQCVDVDEPDFAMTPAMVASIRVTLKKLDADRENGTSK